MLGAYLALAEGTRWDRGGGCSAAFVEVKQIEFYDMAIRLDLVFTTARRDRYR